MLPPSLPKVWLAVLGWHLEVGDIGTEGGKVRGCEAFVLTEEQRAKVSLAVKNSAKCKAALRKLHAMPQCLQARVYSRTPRQTLAAKVERAANERNESGLAHDAIYRGQKLIPCDHRGIASTTLALHLLAPKRDETE